ncbi:hypothetical protein PCANC_15205 [Puccinia coronata f. sp. avenae]|uniref:Uncharacterized protein n=1 Tax=Puccinia coronata f. sp. avenae TaxID=200324 RepID=A0A2N5UF76_9BASI|nr:hypothetical protein PCANC_15205 [Puccinia coronata f. sp. avenae]
MSAPLTVPICPVPGASPGRKKGGPLVPLCKSLPPPICSNQVADQKLTSPDQRNQQNQSFDISQHLTGSRHDSVTHIPFHFNTSFHLFFVSSILFLYHLI